MTKKIFFVLFFFLFLLLCQNLAQAIVAGEIKNLRIESHHFVTQVNGRVNDEVYSRSTTNPVMGRYMILTVRGRIPNENVAILARDFTLVYRNNNREARATCIGITEAQSNGLVVGTFFMTDVFNEPGLSTQGPETILALMFLVSNDTNSFTLYRVGTSETINFTVNSRKLSVFIGTNNIVENNLKAIKTTVENSGCYISLSNEYEYDAGDIKILYMPHAETAAREISQRLREKFDTNITIDEAKIMMSYDIAVLIGKRCLFKNILM